MRVFTGDELARMQATQTSAMFDTCVIQAYSAAQDAYGAMIASYTDGSEISVGFDPTGGREGKRTDMTTLPIDATVRLPFGTSVNAKDRIKITKRFGTALSTALVFDVVGFPQTGPSGIVLDLESVTP